MTDAAQLFDPPEHDPGPARQALERDLSQLTDAAIVGYEAIVALCRQAADAADLAHSRRDTYALTAAHRELRANIDRLPVTIAPQGASDAADPVDAFLAGLSTDVRDAAH